ncbi:hypothetical protein HDU67_003690 [Dinochytrium kinnereticum]|nr:hypothetical protein HDU67_003690 [Dinochytrium kinnereticum]
MSGNYYRGTQSPMDFEREQPLEMGPIASAAARELMINSAKAASVSSWTGSTESPGKRATHMMFLPKDNAGKTGLERRQSFTGAAPAAEMGCKGGDAKDSSNSTPSKTLPQNSLFQWSSTTPRRPSPTKTNRKIASPTSGRISKDLMAFGFGETAGNEEDGDAEEDDVDLGRGEVDQVVKVKEKSRKRKKMFDPVEPARSNSSFMSALGGGGSRFDGRAHLVWPYVLIGYLRLGFTLFIMGLTVFLVVQFMLTVHHDLQMKAEEYSAEITQQVLECSKQYLANKCSPVSERLPAMQGLCNEWELCMSRDPKEVGRLKVGAETLAEILNKLFEPMTYKTMVCDASFVCDWIMNEH